jgi:hypothetical protein
MISTNSKSPKRDTRTREKTNKKNNLQLLFFANRVSQRGIGAAARVEDRKREGGGQRVGGVRGRGG